MLKLILTIVLIISPDLSNEKLNRIDHNEYFSKILVNDIMLNLKYSATVEIVYSLNNKEYIDRDSVRINGKIPFISNNNDISKLLGKPDTIITPNYDEICASYFGEDFKYVYIKGCIFEIYGDRAVLCSIDFRNQFDIKLKTQNLTLDHNTTLDELQKIFPNAVKNKHELFVSELGKTISIGLAPSINPSDDHWLLLFIDGRLIRIDYWMPC